MKKSLKSKITYTLFRVYYPLCLRIEKAKAVHEWHNGVKQCEKMYKEIGSPRVYLFYDSKHHVWSPMTYTDNKKMKPSMLAMRRMGKVSGHNLPYTVDEMKEKAFYYTGSKWGAKSVNENPQLKAEKLKLWVDYYLLKLSEPMQKCRQYLQLRRSDSGQE